MGFKHRHYLAGSKVYCCNRCRTHMATIESMISRRFNGQHGQAYLFDTVFNVTEAEPEDRQMTTGLHRVRDISCKKCGQTMGWKYERAYEQSQKYKEGKAILEKALLVEAAQPPPPQEGSASPPSSNGINSPSSSPPGGGISGMPTSSATYTAIGSMYMPPSAGSGGSEMITSISPTVGPRAQLINVDTSTFTTSALGGAGGMTDPGMANTSTASLAARIGAQPIFRPPTTSAVSARSATSSVDSDESDIEIMRGTM